MARLVAAKCPSCGANVRLDPARDVVVCTFCGATSFIQREGRPPPEHPPNTRVIMVPRSSGAGAGVVLAVMGGVVALAVGLGVVFLSRSAPRPSSPPPVQRGAQAPGAAAKPVPRSEPISISTNRVPMLADANGDGSPDLVVSFSHSGSGATHYVYGAFNGRSGDLLWKTDDLGSSIYQTAAAIDKDRLFVADAKGQLFAYGLRDGKKQWQTSLGDKGARYCRAPEVDSVRVVTADNRTLVVDVKTGGQRPASDKTPCAVLIGHDRPTFSPEPSGYPDGRGPLGAEAWVCGGVRVMGDRNFISPDSCAPRMKISLNAIPSMSVDFIVKEGAGWVLVGSKSPGTRFPMVGFVSGGKLAWTAVVPEGNPLEARTGGPNRVAVSGGLVVVPYGVEAREARVAAFTLESGRRAWDVAVPGIASSVDEIIATRDTVIVGGDRQIATLWLKDGSLRFGVGTIRQ